ncbi:hypothetical protein EXIGLDRAFT_200185 [Exidia glandulosa HHB12029]|uniref:Uncharacterized protein n=1 Tax=Exidia glandulosa HHB12029 TaxID=1314781 RepID=A0A165ESM8_EXIGL|nr:hypothetical protein EXIGLDRAFT_200185 [Exidia glandulosa HHB12029]
MATKDELIAQARRLLESAGVDLSSEDGVRAILTQPRDLPAPIQTATDAQPWPRTLPRDQPPPKCASIVNGRRTPEYALAWRCNPRKLKALAMKVDNDDYIMQCLSSRNDGTSSGPKRLVRL